MKDSPSNNNNQFSTNRKSLTTDHTKNNQSRNKYILVYALKPYQKSMAKWNQSSSTWRNSGRMHSFSKDLRFRCAKPYSLDVLEPNIVGVKSGKVPSFGQGQRTPISKSVLRNAEEKPSPNAYNMESIDNETRSPCKGRSFSSSWNKEEKRYLSYRKDAYSSHFTIDNPPAKYEVSEAIGKDKLAFTVYGRQKMFTEKMGHTMRDVPGPQYLPNDRHLYNTVGMQNCSFTNTNRLDFSAPANNFPGSQYRIYGLTDRFEATRRKNCPD